MTANETTVSRRGLLRTTAGGAACLAAGSATGVVAAQNGDEPDFGGYLDDANLFEGSVDDLRGEDPTVSVGAGEGFAYDSPAIHVDNGATVTWEWTGEGGSHNVVDEDGTFESELVGDEGHTHEYTFDEDGIYLYYCQPHKSMGMKGAVVVGSDYPTTSDGGGSGGSEGGGETGGGGSDDGNDAPESAGNQTAAYTLIGMLALGFLSPLMFALLVRRRMGRGS